ncbi:HupE/UreJ family protein [Thalassomonas viridans]|uniref:HupE/UreJ family protein n=1 Tax=Thalassomonas viridans TaxID=137584 RepID=A0AAE9Z771_9GAMM|nr:HupE/UreJ family protein [Thalassomonas viridans]WDE08021.1 HupE/UreJ family protein [Thalassomonas viridans]
MRTYFWLLWGLCSLLFSQAAAAHQLSTAYLNLNVQAGSIYGSWQVRVRDLERYIPFDSSGKQQNSADGKILWHEIMAKTSQVVDFTREQLSIGGENGLCPLAVDRQLQLDRHFNQPYLVINFTGQCWLNRHMTLSYQAFFAENTRHKAVVTVQSYGFNSNRLFSQSSREQVISLGVSSRGQTFNQYLYQGMIHIWQGIDHILFLLVLLLTVGFSRTAPYLSGKVQRQASWQAITAKKAILRQSACLITAFTLAHSVTLTASALGWRWLPSAYIEGIIALSVLFAALNNIYPVVVKLLWPTLFFGLFHGMGFASVLAELGLAPQQQVLSILAFNLGVELGQLVILMVALPLLIALRFKAWYSKYLIPAGSAAIALIALQWTVERFLP